MPLWFNRIQKYSGSINSEKRELVFQDEALEEQFYQHYSYELDEQPKEVQDLSLHYIHSTSLNIWFYDVFGIKNQLDVDMLIYDFSKISINNSSVDLDIISIIKNIPTKYKIVY